MVERVTSISSKPSDRDFPAVVVPRYRHELKYIVPESMAEEIRAYAQLFCVSDHNAVGDPPRYTVSTLQLDSPNLTLHLAKERKQVNRFKLRVRTYGTDLKSTVFFEVKRKEELYVRKTRSKVSAEEYGDDLFGEVPRMPCFGSDFEVANHCEFLRLAKVLGAKPAVHIRYERESWIGAVDTDVRITMDRKLRYRNAEGYSLCGEDDGKWRIMDSQVGLRRPFAGLILEIKSSPQVPKWILKMVRHFDLTRTGFCKYSAAMRLESLFSNNFYSAGSERCQF